MTTETTETLIDPAVEKSRALLAGLSDLAVAITNHPELASGSVEMSVFAIDPEEWDTVLTALGSYELVEDDLSDYYRRIARFGPVILKVLGPSKPSCPACGRP